VKQAENVYDQVSDDDYAARVAKNRAAGSFVVDDDGRGYDDLGEDDILGGGYGDDEDVSASKKSPTKKKKTGALNAHSNARAKAIAKSRAAAVPTHKIQSAFLNKSTAPTSSEGFSKKFVRAEG